METLERHIKTMELLAEVTHYIIKCDFCGTELFCDDNDFEIILYKPKIEEHGVLDKTEIGKWYWKYSRKLVSSDITKDIFSCKCCNCGHNIKITRAELDKSVEKPNKNIVIKFTNKETDAANAFVSYHKECTKKQNKDGNSLFSFIVTPTSIGNTIHIKCSVCGEEKDITDYDKF